jgi:Tfp pilus assembly protein PilF
MFLQELSKSIQIKEDLYQLQQRSNLSNKIAWNLGNQIKMKNQELNDLKTLAGKIQSAAVSSTYEETFLQFSKYKNIVKAADTITDYSETLMAITNNKTSWKVPESELLFAENLKKAYKDKTLYAELGNKKPEFDESIPIVIVDKRSNIQDNNLAIAEKQKLFNPLPLVEQVSFSEKNIASLLPGKESLELSFTIDNRMEAYSLVQPVNASALKSHNDLADNNLNIDFEVDKAEAIKLVEPVKMNLVAQNADLASEKLEISYINDNRMEAFALVQPVNASALKSHNDLANNNLNIDFEVDKAEAIKLVEPVKMNLVAQNADLASEKLEISYINDNRMDALAQVQPVYASDLISHNDLANNNLNIDFEVDKAEAAKLVEPVKMNLVAKNAEVANEKPEINVNADNKVESIALVQPVYISGQKSQIDLANNNLIIDFKADRVEALKLVEPVKMNLLAKSDKFSNENLEISNYFEKPAILNSYAIIDPVYSNIMTAFNYESEAMEISFSADAVDPIVIVEPVTFATFEQQEIFGNEDIVTGNIPEEKPLLLASKTIEPVTFVAKSTNLSNQNEKLDIDFKLDQARVEKIVEQVEPYSIASIQVNESDIELNFGVDKSVAFTLIQPLEIKDFSKYVQTPAADELEINYDVDLVDFRTYELVQSVDYQPISSPLTGILPIEISFINEPAVNTFDIIEPVTYSMHSENYFKGLDEKLDINLNVDVQPQGAVTDEVAMNAKSVSSQEKSPDIAVNSGRKEQKSTTPAESMYYFREAVVQPNGIESSKSDKELLSKALTSPDDLTYEELLYTASLTDVPEEKLAIYNIAFVHVDRDWRAFNNAAVSAIQSSDLSTANLYLYQASLLSSDNGQIKNNMGILACYENKLDKAKGFFVAASKLGYDAQYNLQLVNNLNKPSRPGDINGQQGDKDNNVIVDIIDYKATEK